MTEAVIFGPDGNNLQPSDVLYKKNILILKMEEVEIGKTLQMIGPFIIPIMMIIKKLEIVGGGLEDP